MKLFDSARDARRFLRNLAMAFALTLLVVRSPVQSFQVSGRSMQPRLVDGERILVEPWTPRLHEVRRGDIVVFRHPSNASRRLIKRIVGLPGETIEISRGTIFLEGHPFVEDYLYADVRDEATDMAPVRLDEGEYFVLGDHRTDSEDSRTWGPVRRPAIVGRAFLAYWPLSEAGPIR